MSIKPSKPSSAPWIETGPRPSSPPDWVGFSQPGITGVLSVALDPKPWCAWAEQLPQRLASDAALPLRQTFLTTSERHTLRCLGPDQQPVVVKCYPVSRVDPRPPEDPPASPPGWAGFSRHLDLHRARLPVPEPLLFFTGIGEPNTSYAVSRWIEGGCPLIEYAFELLRRQRQPAWLHAVCLGALVEAIVQLHRTGHAHGDLHHQNVLVRPQSGGASPEFFWTDFDACRVTQGPPPQPAQLADLAMLAASLHHLVPERLLVVGLNRYFARLGLPRPERRLMASQVVADHERYLAQYQRGFDEVERHCLLAAEKLLAQPPPSACCPAC